ncbi:SRPBCC family protein [Jiangella mangrovi]|uniref:Uncharacterized protein YndB with AHSA1/START domain n=1 Tax=Jiangella mangrovi TaxID=1524084 RepID=A0A7W9GU04_9ACTN|nr:SRPBCC domain-containing protein [Jiangella mangrovi]MBB5790038.1 uncharacterized protein YndB with AHSA1/START domain [Jiangella mangrovi]
MSTLTRGFVIVRRFAASRELVFRSWTDPGLLRWFADTGVPADRHPTTVDLRVGGAWRIDMVESPERRYTTGGVYREIVPPERLVFTWGADGGWPALDPARPDDNPVVTVTFEPVDDGDGVDGGTEMTVHFGFPDHLTDAEVQSWLDLGVEPGVRETVARLRL